MWYPPLREIVKVSAQLDGSAGINILDVACALTVSTSVNLRRQMKLSDTEGKGYMPATPVCSASFSVYMTDKTVLLICQWAA